MLIKSKKTIFTILIILLCVMLTVGCGISGNLDSTYTTASLTSGDLATTIDTTGTVEASSSEEYYLPISSEISEMYVREGGMVEEGDLLYSVDYTTFMTQLSEFESTFNTSLEYSDGVYTIKTVTASQSGWVYEIAAEEGTDVLTLSASSSLCLISTKDEMYVTIESTTLSDGDTVYVKLGSTWEKGTVSTGSSSGGGGGGTGGGGGGGTGGSGGSSGTTLEAGTVMVKISKCYYARNSTVQVYSSDKSTLLGSGSLKYSSKVNVYETEGYVTDVFVTEGEYVEAGDALFNICIPSTDAWSIVSNIISTEDGRLKMFVAVEDEEVEDIMTENDQIAVISTAGTMYVDIESESLSVDDEVDVVIDGVTTDGTVISVDGTTCRVEVPDDIYDVGATAKVQLDGTTLGEGSLQLTEYVAINCPFGLVYEVFVEENDAVEAGEALFTLMSPNREIEANYAAIEELYEDIAIINAYDLYDAVYAESAGIISSISYDEGSMVDAYSTVVTISKTEDYTIDVSLDTDYLQEVSIDQKATATFANGTELTGYISHIDYNANSSYFSLTITLDNCDEITDGTVLPGMYADVSIIEEESLDTQMIPIGALYSSMDGYYVFVDDGSGEGQMTYIEVGIIGSQYVEVLSGLEETDEVLIYDN